jgi:hypothetical protein
MVVVDRVAGFNSDPFLLGFVKKYIRIFIDGGAIGISDSHCNCKLSFFE